MNQTDEPNVSQPPPIFPTEIKTEIPPSGSIHWLKCLLACNPFYLISVALLLYGCYRISLEPGIFGKESAHLIFNFGSLQTYELLLVVTAIFLARRQIWYDSTLLVGLENLLLLVPLILLTQAGLLPNKEMIWAMSVIGGLMAVLRLGSLKWLIAKLNFPPRSLWIGFGALALNVALSIIYRTLHESKFGTRLESGPAFETNEYVWTLLLPMLCALALTLPRAKQSGQLWPERAWLPMGLFSLWSAGTAVHLYCLGYVYDFPLRGDLLAPAFWVVAWVIYARVMMRGPEISAVTERWLLILPILATFVACWRVSSKAFFALTLFNVGIYSAIAWRDRENNLVRRLVLFSLTALIAGFPETWGVSMFANFSRDKCMGMAIAGYFLVWAVRSIDPRIGLVGAIVSAITALIAGGSHESAFHWAVQIGIVFLLLHSLRWMDMEHTGAKMLRLLASALWLGHTVLWTHTTGRTWMPCVVAGTVIVIYLITQILRREWSARVIPFAGVLVLLAGPAEVGGNKLETFPTGLLAVIGSFFLFAVGTVAALTRQRWHKIDS